MPYITVKLMEGRSDSKKRTLIEKLTEVTANTLNIQTDQIRVELVELKEGNFAIGGKLAQKKLNK